MKGFLLYLVIIFLSLIGVCGDYFLKLAGNGSKYIIYKFFFMGLLIFLLSTIGWFLIFKHVKFSTIGIIYGITTTLVFMLIGIIFLKEKLNYYEIVGIIAGITSLILLMKYL